MKRLVPLCCLLVVCGSALVLLQRRGKSPASSTDLPPPITFAISGESPTETETRAVPRPAWNKFEKIDVPESPLRCWAKFSYRAVIEGDTLRFYIVEFIQFEHENNCFQRDRKVLLTEQTIDLSKCQPRSRYALRVRSKGKHSEFRLAEDFMTTEGYGFETARFSERLTPRQPSERKDPHLLQVGGSINERIVEDWVIIEPDPEDPASTPLAYVRQKPVEWEISVIEIPPNGNLHSSYDVPETGNPGAPNSGPPDPAAEMDKIRRKSFFKRLLGW